MIIKGKNNVTKISYRICYFLVFLVLAHISAYSGADFFGKTISNKVINSNNSILKALGLRNDSDNPFTLNDNDLFVGGSDSTSFPLKRFKVVNNHDFGGDVVVWFEQSNRIECERIARINAESSASIEINCPQLLEGDISIHAGWAENHKNLASVAERIGR
ncbi:hypothetical protein [Alteromonas oceanisediminis]|uniref:hypothetical protein n=1 Tax=Alteromonas oceanisediminis TaxID=2836180 RepID=UPI001BD98B3B|nr:hypothetical protein [Alteromonas oceanisediminis]MBT0585401.1 hypothetical protein [Alteromonas oceanisediminis]